MKAAQAHRRKGWRVAAVALGSSLICIAAVTCEAQQAAPNPYTDLSQYIVSGHEIVPQQALAAPAGATGGLSSTVSQIGQGNVASVALSGSSNVTTQYQVGSGNSSTLSINGTQNTITTSQIGNSNTTAIDVAGNGNSISNLQVGSGLSYQLQVVGKSVPISVQQYGRK
jgi:TPP-dependent pyruvate/acetoin dehydrogenase alpha subunit